MVLSLKINHLPIKILGLQSEGEKKAQIRK